MRSDNELLRAAHERESEGFWRAFCEYSAVGALAVALAAISLYFLAK